MEAKERGVIAPQLKDWAYYDAKVLTIYKCTFMHLYIKYVNIDRILISHYKLIPKTVVS